MTHSRCHLYNQAIHHKESTKYNALFVFMHVVRLPCRCTFKRPRWPSLWVSVPRCPLGCSTCQRCTWFSSTRSRMCPSAHVASRPWLPPPPCPTNSTPRLDSDPMGRPRRSCAKAWRRKVRTQMQMWDMFWRASGDGEVKSYPVLFNMSLNSKKIAQIDSSNLSLIIWTVSEKKLVNFFFKILKADISHRIKNFSLSSFLKMVILLKHHWNK